VMAIPLAEPVTNHKAANTAAPGGRRSIMRVQQNPEPTQYTLLLSRLAGPQHIGVLCVCPTPRQRNALGYEQVCGIIRYTIVPAGTLGRRHRRTG
jgi:hypothetical protein